MEKEMTCETCARWITAHRTIYDDGSEIRTFEAAAGKGRCELLGIETPVDFGCNGYAEGTEHIITTRKTGKPHEHWHMGPCPDCKSHGNAGDGACHRCAGTGNVRYYDDGFIGEERTRLHPKERELAGKPKCLGCGREVEVAWVACPACGHKLDAAVAAESVIDPLFSSGG